MSEKQARRKAAACHPCHYIRMSEVDQDVSSYTALRHLVVTLLESKRIVVVAGAGISTSAGVPDFRSSNGLFRTESNKEKMISGKDMFDISVYYNSDSLDRFHKLMRELAVLCERAKPTAFHRMLAAIAMDGRLLRLYTQNVDYLDERLPALSTEIPLQKRGDGSWPVSVQLHGTLRKMTCTKCVAVFDFNAQIFEGGTLPDCPKCIMDEDERTRVRGKRPHGIGGLRPRIVLYGEEGADGDAITDVLNEDLLVTPDVLIVVGTSLKVPGAQRLVRKLEAAMRIKGKNKIIWINKDAPENVPGDIAWSTIVHGECDEIAQYVALGFD